MYSRAFGLSAAVMLSLITAVAEDMASLKKTTRDGRLSPVLANLGNLHRPVTTRTPDAQKFFDQGLTLVYGFNHAEAVRSFREAARLDPDCAMAYWGQALALAPNINEPAIPADRERAAYEAIQEALKRKAHASAKEAALIDAMAARFAAVPPENGREALNAAYARAMEPVYKRFPDDPDVAVLYADSVMNTMPWNYWTSDSKPHPGIPEAREALEKTIRAYPRHPGARHFYIHLMEASNEVDLAVPSADVLGGLVPGAGHLVHMPAHVYIRVGRYADAVAANIHAIAADEDYISQCRAQGIYPAGYYPHNIHFLNAALMMDGRGREALEAARRVATKHDHEALHEPGFGFPHLLKSLPLLTMVRFGRWEEILTEPEPGEDQPFGRAMRHFARGFAYSALGKPDRAKTELALLERAASDPALKPLKIFDLNSLETLAKIAAAMLAGDIAEKAGESEKSIASFRSAVELEDGLLYSEPPDWPLPPRQFLAHAYLSAGKPAEAERVYREDLVRHRSNGWSLRGLELSLRREGRTEEAGRVHDRFASAWARADVKLEASRF
jgi:tetratricopeptide (TPR) repeat protein